MSNLLRYLQCEHDFEHDFEHVFEHVFEHDFEHDLKKKRKYSEPKIYDANGDVSKRW